MQQDFYWSVYKAKQIVQKRYAAEISSMSTRTESTPHLQEIVADQLPKFYALF